MEREITRLYYDGQGHRLVKEYDPKTGNSGMKRTEYTFDGLDPVVEYALWNGQHTEYYRGEDGALLTGQLLHKASMQSSGRRCFPVVKEGYVISDS